MIDAVLNLPTPIFYVVMLTFGFWLLSFILKMRAASINDSSGYFPPGVVIIRRFGMGPGNRYLFCGAHGWERIIGRDPHYGTLRTDQRDRESRVIQEIMSRNERRRQFVYPSIVIAVDILLFRLIILPAPFETLFHPLDGYTYPNLLNNIVFNMGMAIRFFISKASDFWSFVLGIFIIFILLSVIIATALRVIAHFRETAAALGREFLYLIGYQDMIGAKVFDALPGQWLAKRPPSIWSSLYRLLFSSINKLKVVFTVLGHYFSSSYTTAGTSSHSGQSGSGNNQQSYRKTGGDDEAEQRQSTTGSKSALDEAYEWFGVSPHCTKDEFMKEFRATANRYHPDKQGDIPEAQKRNMEEGLKTTNRYREIIDKERKWKKPGRSDG